MHNMSKSNTLDSQLNLKRSQAKARSFMEISKKTKPDVQTTLREFDVEVSPNFKKNVTVESLLACALQLIEHVYESDPLGIAKFFRQLLNKDLQKLRQRLQQRLSLLMYLADSLKFKPFTQVQRQILKEWKKNVIFFSINTIWAARVRAHKFISVEQFTQEYKKQVTLVANLTHFYFKQALLILDGKDVATFCYLQQDTSHKILNSLKGWEEIQKQVYLPLLKRRNSARNLEMAMSFNPKTLNINPQYLDIESGKTQLVQTIEKIKKLSGQFTIHSKIDLLRQIRATFVRQIEGNRQQIAKKTKIAKFSTLEKDDIIGCMIYCIIQGQITDLQLSIQALSELLGPKNELLSRKGVDSYRADLESAVEYLCQQSEMSSKQRVKLMKQEQIKVQIARRSTSLYSHDSA